MKAFLIYFYLLALGFSASASTQVVDFNDVSESFQSIQTQHQVSNSKENVLTGFLLDVDEEDDEERRINYSYFTANIKQACIYKQPQEKIEYNSFVLNQNKASLYMLYAVFRL